MDNRPAIIGTYYSDKQQAEDMVRHKNRVAKRDVFTTIESVANGRKFWIVTSFVFLPKEERDPGDHDVCDCSLPGPDHHSNDHYRKI